VSRRARGASHAPCLLILPLYLTWPDRARLVPQVLRLAMAQDDADLAQILFDDAGA
jgi:hypothetical protein